MRKPKQTRIYVSRLQTKQVSKLTQHEKLTETESVHITATLGQSTHPKVMLRSLLDR